MRGLALIETHRVIATRMHLRVGIDLGRRLCLRWRLLGGYDRCG